MEVKISTTKYPGRNHSTRTSYQAHIEDENGTWIQQAPVRDSFHQAQEDARLMSEYLRQRAR